MHGRRDIQLGQAVVRSGRDGVDDAAEDVYDAADIGLENSGGRGAVREAIEYILAAQDKWEKIVASYEQAGQGDRQ